MSRPKAEPGARPQLRPQLFDPSGGLRWHLRALRYRKRHWQPFVDTVASWLDAWHPPCRRLLIVGPSAGWTLPPPFIKRFASVTALEPDPLARRLLAHRFRPVAIRFDPSDLFAGNGLDVLARRYAEHAILFANVLGQLAPADNAAAWCEHLRGRLTYFHWASYHDLAAAQRAPDRTPCRQFDGEPSLESVLSHYWQGGSLEIVDHGTLSLAGGAPFETAAWTLTPRQHHLVAWHTHAPPR